MKVGRRYLLFGLAFLCWAICFYGALAIAGAGWSYCQGDGHVLPNCNSDLLTVAWLVPIVILFGGGWLMKRLAGNLRIDF